MTESEIPDTIETLRELVSISSPSGSEEPAVEYLVKLMTKMGLEAQIDEVGNAVGSTKGKGVKILMVGHVDTVVGEIPVRESEGMLFGRGTVDAKGPLMAMIFAAARFVDRSDINITVIGAVEEESSSKGARALGSRYQPDYVIIGEPSGWEGICIGYKGHMQATYKVECPPVHRAHPRANAIEVALQYYADVQNLCGSRTYFKTEPLFETLSVAPMDIRIERGTLKNTVELDLDIRIPHNLSISELENNLNALVNDGTLNIYHTDPPVLVDKNNPLVRSLLKAIRSNNGIPKFKKKTGTSDMNILAQDWSVPIISYGPGDSSLDHTPEEHIDLEEYQRAIKVLADAVDALVE
ncbi:MAG: [LysW]-lysine hydrolase [Thermoplasmata archaeon]|nr:MAG: [LysW]-lysine hydrolase [Thermoplasmata archaeon]